MNLFLTGDIQIGKSTAIQIFLKRYDIKTCGFRTLLNRNTSELMIHLFNKAETISLTAAGKHPQTGYPEPDTDAFDRAGKLIRLSDTSDYALFIMDELGFMEKNALIFRQVIEEILRSDIPVLGVIRNRPDGPFWDLVHSLEDTRIITVSEKNRDDIPALLACELGYA